MIYTDCNGIEAEYNTNERNYNRYIGDFTFQYNNYWYLRKGDILVHLNHNAKNEHSLMIKQWCWRQGWNTANGEMNVWSTVPDQRYTNRAFAFIFYRGEKAAERALLFKMRWG